MSDEAEIRNLLEARARCIHDKDAEGALRFYADDIVNFDLAPPLAYRGADALNPAGLREWFDTWDGPIGMDSTNWKSARPTTRLSRSALCIWPARGPTVPTRMPGFG